VLGIRFGDNLKQTFLRAWPPTRYSVGGSSLLVYIPNVAICDLCVTIGEVAQLVRIFEIFVICEEILFLAIDSDQLILKM
jgi:hypothetical protein